MEFTLKVLNTIYAKTTLSPLAISEINKDLMTFLKLKKIDSIYYIYNAPNSICQRIYNKIWEVQKKSLFELAEICKNEGIDIVIFKGAQFIECYYNSIPISIMEDVDLLVPRHQFPVIMGILYCLGFKPVAYFDQEKKCLIDLDIERIAQILSGHYELPAFCKLLNIELSEEEKTFIKENNFDFIKLIDSKAYFIMNFDVHQRITSNIDSSPFFDRAINSQFCCGKMLGIADLVWNTLSKFYTEVALYNKNTLRDFAYLIPTITDPRLDWDIVLRAASIYNIRPSIYYYLYFINKLTQESVPKYVLDELLPTRGDLSYDWGWQINKLFGSIELSPFEHSRSPPKTAELARSYT